MAYEAVDTSFQRGRIKKKIQRKEMTVEEAIKYLMQKVHFGKTAATKLVAEWSKGVSL